LDAALDAGVKIVDVNPHNSNGSYVNESGYEHLKLTAKAALEEGRLLNKIKSIVGR
jgi:hypothetical protein